MKALIYLLDDREYAVDIAEVIAVRRLKRVIAVPGCAPWIVGVSPLLGTAVPLIDLRLKWKKAGQETTSGFSRTVITRCAGHTVGFLVDRVIEVMHIDESSLVPPDHVLHDAAYLQGTMRAGNRLLLVVDLPRMLGEDEVSDLSAVHRRIELRRNNEQQ